MPRGTYRCPGCGEAVHPKNLFSKREACFQHFEAPSDACNRYFGGLGDNASNWPPPSPSLQLSLALDVDERRQQNWHLLVHVPESDVPLEGIIRLLSGEEIERHLQLEQLNQPCDVLVRPSQRSYQIVAIDGDARRYLDQFAPGGQAITLHRPGAAFEITRSGRSRQARRELYWSRDYFVVHESALAIPAALGAHALQQHPGNPLYHDWRCSRLHLPSEPDTNLAGWIETTLGLPVHEPPAKARTLYPPLLGIPSPTRVERTVPLSNEILVAIDATHPHPSAQLVAAIDTPIASVPLAGVRTFAVLTLATPLEGTLIFGVDPDPDAPWYPLLALTATSSRREIPTVSFVPEDGAAIANDDPGFFAFLAALRTRRSRLRAISNPAGVDIAVETRATPALRWRGAALGCNDAAAFVALLSDTALEARVKVGGRVAADFLAIVRSAETTPAQDPLVTQHNRLGWPAARRAQPANLAQTLTLANGTHSIRARATARRDVRPR
jgi:hypothetical protein